jgi:hypothetical protein
VSLEAKQALNNALIESAQFQAARQTLGLSQEDMLAAVSRKRRRQARADQQFDPEQYLRQIAQSEKTTRSDVGRQELDGLKFLDNDENDAGFGQMQDDLQKYSKDDRGYIEDEETGELRRARLTDEKPVEMGEFESFSRRQRKKDGKSFTVSEIIEQPIGFEGANAPKSVLADALAALNAAQNPSPYGYDQFPGGVTQLRTTGSTPAAVAGLLEDDIRPNLEAERSLTSDLLIQDRSNYNPRMRAENDEAVGHLADTIARLSYTVNGPGAMADEAIGRIGEIRRLGAAGSLGEMEQTQVIRQGPQGTFPNAEEIVDNTGRIVGYADPVTKAPIALDPALGISLSTQGANTPDTAQMMNAPQNPQTAREWTASNLPAMVQDTGSTPPRFPQANISKETTEYSGKLNAMLKGLGLKSAPNVRLLDEIDIVANEVQKRLQAKGKTLYVKDEFDKNIPAGTQVVSGLMNKIGMTGGDEERLANSMFQLDAARRSSVNQNPTGTYLGRTNTPVEQPQISLSPDNYKGVSRGTAQALVENERRKRGGVEFDSPSEGFGSIQIAQQKKGTRGPVGTRGEKGSGRGAEEDITKRLGKLETSGAQKPYIGMPAKRSTSPLSTFGQQVVYNRTGESDPAAIRSTLEQLSENRAQETAARKKRPESRADAAIRRKRNESNIIGAQAVERRANEAREQRLGSMREIMRYIPANRRRNLGA